MLFLLLFIGVVCVCLFVCLQCQCVLQVDEEKEQDRVASALEFAQVCVSGCVLNVVVCVACCGLPFQV